MRKLNQTGSLLLPFIIVLLLLFGAAGFAGWAYTGRQDYKNKSDTKAAAAAKAAIAVEAQKKDAEFAEAEKSPTKTYNGPATYGSITFNYPKTWNQYVSSETSSLPVNNYFNPGYVPDISATTPFALRLQVSSQAYITMLKSFDSTTKAGTSVVSAYRPAKLPSVLGTTVTGEIGKKNKGVMVLLPIRDKTIVIWTEGNDSTADFTNTVLPSLSFSP